MRILVYADPHWSSYSSIVRSRGKKYSTRLENLVDSINWVEKTASEYQCDRVVCLGDFFDKAELNSEEITALQDVLWADTYHSYVVGNHEMGRSNLQFSSSHLFMMCPDASVSDQLGVYESEDTQLVFLPYILEQNRKPLSEYLSTIQTYKKRIIFSHNDIKDIQMGRFLSKEGFSVSEIEENCDLFINGHLHNTSQVGDKIINLGNITGQNFSEDAFNYRHYALYIDTANQKIEWLENPYAFNFYKLDLVTYRDNDADAQKICNIIDSLAPNSVITVKTTLENKMLVEDLIYSAHNIVESRIIIEMLSDSDASQSSSSNDIKVDHISRFIEYVKKEIGSSELVLDELSKVTEGE